MKIETELKILGHASAWCCILTIVGALLASLYNNYPKHYVLATVSLTISYSLYSLIRTKYLYAELKRQEDLANDIESIGLK